MAYKVVFVVFIPCAQQSCLRGGGTLASHLPCVRPTSRVRFEAPTVLVGSILYLCILSSNFRRRNMPVWLCLLLTLMWITTMGNHGVAGDISEYRCSNCSSYTPCTAKLLGVIMVSLRPSVRLSHIPCLLCSVCSSGWIHFIFIQVIKQFQRMSCV